MVLRKQSGKETFTGAVGKKQVAKLARIRLAVDFFNGRYRAGESVKLYKIAERYEVDVHSALKILREFQTLGMITLAGNASAVFHSPNSKEMQEAYEVRAALEEVGGRAAARVLKGNIGPLQRELDGMRVAFRRHDLDSFVEHDVAFHRYILQSSQNEALLRVWDSLAVDLRIRAVVAKVSRDFPEVVESHQPIIDALEKGRPREAGLLLRNHVETIVEFIRKSDSGLHRALRRDLEGAKDVQQAFFPPQTLSIPCLSCETFYQPVHGIGGDYYDFLSLQCGRWGIAIGDVSGKGIGAALLMASLQASLRAQALHPHLDLSTLIGDVNRLVYHSSPTNFFASLFYAEYEPATRVLKYVNAGHNPPIVVRPHNGSCEIFLLQSEAMPVGISADAPFRSTVFQLEIGDVLVAYTDGITETENRDGDFWGQERLENLLRSCSRGTPEQIIQCTLDEMSAFADGQPQHDDVTLVVMGVQEGCDVPSM